MTRFNKSKTKKTITKYRQNKKFETIYGTKSLDQIQKDIKNNTTELNENIYYCIECSRNLNTERDFMAHKKTTTHKRRVKMLKEIQHTQKDAEMAAGLYYCGNGRIFFLKSILTYKTRFLSPKNKNLLQARLMHQQRLRHEKGNFEMIPRMFHSSNQLVFRARLILRRFEIEFLYLLPVSRINILIKILFKLSKLSISPAQQNTIIERMNYIKNFFCKESGKFIPSNLVMKTPAYFEKYEIGNNNDLLELSENLLHKKSRLFVDKTEDLMELADSKIEKEMPNQLEYDEKSDEKFILKLERFYHIFIKIKELQDWIRE
ncbi:hypothetical protein CWI38_0218p0030 [Hamiltosporidium tvaerminnensis]|uniref:C2H2-type domain-containing protein n=2 Tax=Hamiltosporidium TaxID=1176354 RepID=A0A4Q9LZG1_9MICR|nr:hypothetical protein CWI38_0218p0030 [Hamiltosporidium tvaerminnensis]